MAELHPIPMNEASDAFLDCWGAAVKHLRSMPTDHALRLCNVSSSPPWLEHLCFLFGNQIFFVCLEDAAGVLDSPSGRRHSIMAAEQASGIPCVLEMKCSGELGPCSGRVVTPTRSDRRTRHSFRARHAPKNCDQ